MRYMYSYMWLTTICMVIAICYIITYIHELETSIYRRCPIAMFDCRRLDNQQTGFFDISWNLRWKWRLAVNNILVAWRTHEWNDSDKAAWKKSYYSALLWNPWTSRIEAVEAEKKSLTDDLPIKNGLFWELNFLKGGNAEPLLSYPIYPINKPVGLVFMCQGDPILYIPK